MTWMRSLPSAPTSLTTNRSSKRAASGATRALPFARCDKVVTRARFERATPSFGGWCSIQLSYRATRGARWVGLEYKIAWWGVVDSNHRPPRCEHGALAS